MIEDDIQDLQNDQRRAQALLLWLLRSTPIPANLLPTGEYGRDEEGNYYVGCSWGACTLSVATTPLGGLRYTTAGTAPRGKMVTLCANPSNAG